MWKLFFTSWGRYFIRKIFGPYFDVRRMNKYVKIRTLDSKVIENTMVKCVMNTDEKGIVSLELEYNPNINLVLGNKFKIDETNNKHIHYSYRFLKAHHLQDSYVAIFEKFNNISIIEAKCNKFVPCIDCLQDEKMRKGTEESLKNDEDILTYIDTGFIKPLKKDEETLFHLFIAINKDGRSYIVGEEFKNEK